MFVWGVQEMKIIIKARRMGKTTDAIKIASENFSYLVCLNQKEVYRVSQEARKMGLDIPFPITIDEFINGKFCGKGIRGFVIDNAEYILTYLARTVPINAITMNTGDE